MARPLRIAYPGAFYHVTSRGNERKAVFKSKRDRENFLANQKSDKDLPALRELTSSLSMQDIFCEVEAVFGKDSVLAKNMKMYLCRHHTAEKLKTIGSHFGIGESAVSHACRKAKSKIKGDRKLKKKIEKLEKRLARSRIKT